MRRYYVEITTRGKVVFSRFFEAETEARAFDLAWDAFDPEGDVDFLDTSHNAWMMDVTRLDRGVQVSR